MNMSVVAFGGFESVLKSGRPFCGTEREAARIMLILTFISRKYHKVIMRSFSPFYFNHQSGKPSKRIWFK